MAILSVIFHFRISGYILILSSEVQLLINAFLTIARSQKLLDKIAKEFYALSDEASLVGFSMNA